MYAFFMAYAHAVIEVTETDEETGQTVVVARYERNDTVPEDTPGYDELVAGGAVGDELVDEDEFKPQPPDEIEIDGVVYKRSNDGANSAEASDA